MTLEELKEYPNALDALRTYYTKKLEESIEHTQDVPDDFKEMVRTHGITHVDETIVAVTESNPASLFYFFDEYKIIIEMTYMHEIGLGQFVSLIDGEMTGMTYPSRKDAESFVVEVAIEMLEEQLTNLVSAKENS